MDAELSISLSFRSETLVDRGRTGQRVTGGWITRRPSTETSTEIIDNPHPATDIVAMLDIVYIIQIKALVFHPVIFQAIEEILTVCCQPRGE